MWSISKFDTILASAVLIPSLAISIIYGLFGDVEYAVFFFEKIYIIIFITLFGFYLVTIRGLTTVATTIEDKSTMFDEDDEKEGFDDRRAELIENSKRLYIFSFIVFILAPLSWTAVLIFAQHNMINFFSASAFLCIALLILLPVLTLYAMYVTLYLQAGNQKYQSNEPMRVSLF